MGLIDVKYNVILRTEISAAIVIHYYTLASEQTCVEVQWPMLTCFPEFNTSNHCLLHLMSNRHFQKHTMLAMNASWKKGLPFKAGDFIIGLFNF